MDDSVFQRPDLPPLRKGRPPEKLEAKIPPGLHLYTTDVPVLLDTEASMGKVLEQNLLAMPLREAREIFERAYLAELSRLYDGRVVLMAKHCGVERTHLYRKLRDFGMRGDATTKEQDHEG